MEISFANLPQVRFLPPHSMPAGAGILHVACKQHWDPKTLAFWIEWNEQATICVGMPCVWDISFRALGMPIYATIFQGLEQNNGRTISQELWKEKFTLDRKVSGALKITFSLWQRQHGSCMDMGTNSKIFLLEVMVTKNTSHRLV